MPALRYTKAIERKQQRSTNNNQQSINNTQGVTHMNTMNLIRAWKDAEFRATLSAEELAALPQHPAGLVELPEEEMAAVAGGRSFFTGTCGRVCQILTPQYGCDLSIG
jgi:mersacidin/lichenicidin family type 2 lantibiotic